MAALTSASFVVLFVCSWIFVLCQGTQELKVTVKDGEDATLQCQSHGGAAITVIAWSRTDLKPDDDYVFLFRNGRSNEKDQHPSFRDRVELHDPEMKDGDASVILKNVNINDTGTYECWIKKGNNPGKPELINTIKLTVTGGNQDGGGQERNVGPMVGLPVFAVLLVAAAVGTMIFIKRRGKTAHPGEQTDSLNPPTSG